MPQKPVIYVRRITNLSDARYCAGMGVDMLGFVIDPKDTNYVSPAQYQEMIGWVSGPKRVIEITAEVIGWDEVISQYKPDLLHVSLAAISKQGLPDLPLIVEMNFEELLAKNLKANIEYLLISNFHGTTLPKNDHPILISIEKDQESIVEFLHRTGATGVALQGSRELSPGLKDYDHLSRILEELDH